LNGRPDENISVLNGLAKKNGFLAFVLAISMLSLSGIPLTAGFWGKFMVFNDAASKGYWWLLIVAICMSAVSIYYYFKPIRAAFLKKSDAEDEIFVPLRYKLVFILCLVGTLVFGLAPDLLRMIF
jgi:NADH-quinone oxidoreductase subunit N